MPLAAFFNSAQSTTTTVWWVVAYIAVGWLIRAAMVPVILRRALAPGASVAWLGIIFLHPYIGWTLYMLIGETRLGPHRVERHRELVQKYRRAFPASEPCPPELSPAYETMVLQAEKIGGMPIVCGNNAEFIGPVTELTDRIIADIAAAQSTVHLQYYIFAPDATGRRVADALIAAVRRGVVCRVLVDAVASRTFFGRKGLDRELRAGGVKVAAALPVAPIQRRLPRMDLRNHRKLAIVNNHLAYMGSHNLIKADYGGRRGAPWVDFTGRFTGPIVAELATVFAEDWAFESGEQLDIPAFASPPISTNGTPMQIVPTGPTAAGESYRRVLLAAIQCAQHRIILTTPYFVPDDPTMIALIMAADRGVNITLVLPETPDHAFTAAAGRAAFNRLLRANISIHLYHPGLLHAKTTTIDDAFAFIGSANLDVRSFNLNFELTALLYGKEITNRIRAQQMTYLADSTAIKAAEWTTRTGIRPYIENALALLSPLL